MLSVNSVHQFFSPGDNFALSEIGSSESSKIAKIRGESPGQGTLLTWAPDLELPMVRTVKSNRAYWIQSNQSGFAPYSIDLNSSGYHEQNNWIERTTQFFTFRGEAPFLLGELSSSVKSKIKRVHKVNAAGNMIVAWSPTAALNPFVEFVPYVTYIIESVSQGFVPYDIGAPPPLEFLNDALLPDIGLLPY